MTRRIAGTILAVAGLALMGAEGPGLDAQLAVNLLGLVLFAIPAMIVLFSQKRRSFDD
jgi:hypothetical protein